MGGLGKKVSGFQRDSNPYYASGDSLPELPTFLKQEDPEGFKKYDREIREWWTEVQENLDKLQDKLFTYKLNDLEGRVISTTSEIDEVSRNAVSEVSSSIEEQKKEFLNEISDIRNMLYSES
jgi:hypothetical protein